MTPSHPDVSAALEPLRSMLRADGYDLSLDDEHGELVGRISAGPEACADCLVPKNVMTIQVENALREAVGLAVPPIRLVYPTESAS